MKLVYILVLLLLFSADLFPGNPNNSVVSRKEGAQLMEHLNGNGLLFTENKGQITDENKKPCPEMLYKGGNKGTDIYLRKTGITYVFNTLKELMQKANRQTEELKVNGALNEVQEKQKREEFMDKETLRVQRIDMSFVGTSNAGAMTTEDGVEGYVNFYYPSCPRGVLNIKQYNKVRCQNIYDHIDVCYYGSKSTGIKYDIIVQPHGDPGLIKMQWTGVQSMHINKDGRLTMNTAINEFYESIPKVYQNINGKIVEVEAQYSIESLVHSTESTSSVTDDSRLTINDYIVSFKLGTYNPEYPLIIDPWATYYGGSDFDTGTSIATDNLGNLVITGKTRSIDLPVLPGSGYSQPFGGIMNAFVAKFNSAGNRQWACYYGGTGSDYALGIATDNSNNMVITGFTGSTDFPVTVGAFQTNGDIQDAFVVKFDPAGTVLWSTYCGGSHFDIGNGIATDATGNVLITGYSGSSDFPVLAASGYSQPFGGSLNAIVVKFDPTGHCLWSSFYGGQSQGYFNQDYGVGVAADNTGNILITGYTTSVNFPVLSGGGYTQSYAGGQNVFIAKFNSGGTQLWSTCYGGGSGITDYGQAIAADNSGNIIVTGTTNSANFPVTAGAYQTVIGGPGIMSAYLLKFKPNGARTWATFYGDALSNWGWGIATDPDNSIYLLTESEDNAPSNLVDPCSYDPVFNGGYATDTVASTSGSGNAEDQLIVKFNSSGGKVCATFIGGPGEDDLDFGGAAIALSGNALSITGITDGGYPVTSGAFQTAFAGPDSITLYSGGGDAFVATICKNICEGKTLGLNFTAVTNVCVNAPVTFTPGITNACDTSGDKFHWTFTGGTPATSDSVKPTVVFSGVGTHDVKLVVTTFCKKDSISNAAYITVNPCGVLSSAITKKDIPCKGSSTGSAIVTAFSGTANYTYSWSNGSSAVTTSATDTLTGLTAKTYTVTITDGSSNTTSATFTITEPAALTVSAITIKNASCGNNNGSLTLALPTGGTSAYTYLWSNGATTQNINSLAAAGYTVTVTDHNGCTTSTNATIISTGGTAVSLSVTPINCNGGTGSITATASSSSSPYTYSWSNGASAITSSLTNSITSLLPANYAVTVTDGSGCTASSTIALTAPPAIMYGTTVINNATCGHSDGSAIASASGGTGILTYSWNTAASGQTANNLSGGTYTVTVRDANGCSILSTVVINNGNGPTIVTAVQTAINCFGQTGAAEVTTSGGAAPYTYSWSTGASTVTSSLNNSITSLLPATYTVTITDNTGCSTTSIIGLTQPKVLTASITTTNDDCGKSNGTATVTVNGGTAQYTYSWSNGSSAITSSLNNLITSLPANSYTVTVTDSKGCTISTNDSVKNQSAAEINITPATQTIAEGAGVAITVSGGISYTWTPATALTCTNCSNPVATPKTSTVYTVTATDINGCTISAELSITVKPDCAGNDADVFVANIFSPNEDGKNDILYIEGNGLTNIYWAIYDRWGNLLFEAFDQSQGWDGTKKGNPMETGTYVYYLKAMCIKTNNEVKMKGNVSIIK